jgi:pyruvate,water dikinase
MKERQSSIDKLMESLQERAKELNCLYKVEELLADPDRSIDVVCDGIIEAIPPGWQYSDICEAQINLDGKIYQSPDFFVTPWVLTADIKVQDIKVGKVIVYYTDERPGADIGPFLKEEKKLIETIADRVGHFILHQRMRRVVQEWETAKADLSASKKAEWQVILDLLRQTDRNLFLSISHKMLNFLCWSGIAEAEELRANASTGPETPDEEWLGDSNRPREKRKLLFSEELSQETFKIASEYLSDHDLLARLQKWIQEDKLSFLVQVVNRNLPLSEVADAIRRYHHLASDEADVHSPNKKGVEVSLIRRFLSDQLSYINVAKSFIDVADFYDLLKRVIFAPESHGKLGGKSAGLYLARQIIKKDVKHAELLENVKIPKTWHITSDMLLQFMHYNNFDEVVEQKYKEINQVRVEYPHIAQTFKNSQFPSEIVQGLSVALDDFGDCPLIVRSSSLLEDRVGAAFSGKYKSLFVANQGTKQERIEMLTDAIAEVYASTFSPDPIEYRAERGLIDFGEEMGIIVQEVVGTRVGKYFMPVFAGVAFSRNEYRWSPRIKREDGLIRMVPGLGTRAVDRLGDDYPVLVAPGQPELRANVTVEEMVRYCPRQIDVINLETNAFETMDICDLLREVGLEMPMVSQIVSLYEDDHVSRPSGLTLDFEKSQYVVTFEGLISQTKLVSQVNTILKLLEDKLGTPVDIEFAHDGESFYLLQCRAQSYSEDSLPAPIPKDLPEDRIVFSANRYVSNGRVDGITHIVYVDPQSYSELAQRSEILAVGRCVSHLNKLLPKHQFILMGPGRWGSRGDIKLGVSVTYSDINNSAMLIEVARKVGNYVPDLSFGTHFFQDLVEANIRYLPLYPDDEGILFNELFLRRTDNILADVLPEFAHLSNTVRLIDVPRATDGLILQVLMNADLDEAVAILTHPEEVRAASRTITHPAAQQPDNYWRWRLSMAEHIAAHLDARKFGVEAFYVFGSTKNGTAGPASDIDIIVHFKGKHTQLELLRQWLSGWSFCLDEMNYLQTGYRTGGLLDVHIVTDEDIAAKSSYASKIGAITDAARPLPIGKKTPD